MKDYNLYVVDVETTGIGQDYDIVELSLYRLADNEQKTWHIKPFRTDNFSPDALRVNGLKADDLKGLTKEGSAKYLDPNKVIVEIENWITEGGFPSTNVFLVGHNVNFDKSMMEALWKKCNSYETFPFSKKYSIDTMGLEFFFSYCNEENPEGFSLYATTKKYGIKNEAAHTAAADTRATVSVFNKQVSYFKKLLNK